MLKELSIENFKSFKQRVDIKIPQFTILIGKNGSGKSSILQLLLLLKQHLHQSVDSSPFSEGPLLKLGDFSKFVHDPTKAISIGIKGSMTLQNIESSYYKELDYSYRVNFNPNPRIVSFTIYLKGDYALLKMKLGLQSSVLFDLRPGDPSYPGNQQDVYWDEHTQTGASPSKISIRSDAFPPILKGKSFPPNRNTEAERFSKIIQSINQEIVNDLENISYVPALRGFDSYQYQLLGKSADILSNPENFRAQSEGLASNIAYDQDTCDEMSSIISKILERKVRFRIVHGPTVLVEIYNGINWVNLFNDGFGLNPLIHLIFQVIVAKPKSLILIEEPEIHLHPSAQSKLSSQIVHLAMSEDKQLVMTTHSEHTIFGFLEKIMEKKIDQNQVALYYFEYSNDGSKIVPIEVTTHGTLIGGMKGFFETDLEHLQKFYNQIGSNLDNEPDSG